MEALTVTTKSGSLHVEGYPDAVKIVAISGPKATRLAHLALHSDDLRNALHCLDAINEAPNDVLRDSAWFTAIVLFMKCFQSSSRRGPLDAKKIYGSNNTALLCFDYFKALRNKHFVHDENDYAQAHPGAIINNPSATGKIAKIVVSTSSGVTLEERNWQNLRQLVTDALKFVEASSDAIANALTVELESETIEALLGRPKLQLTVPNVKAIGDRRSAP